MSANGTSLRHVAIDLGASGGRVACGSVIDGVLQFDILHRFPNRAVPLGPHLYWNMLELWREIRIGLRKAAACGDVVSLGVTTWGVDYALLDEDDLLIGMVHSHRDRRTDGVTEALDQTMSATAIYRATGIQFLPINSLPQLVAARRPAPHLFARAKRFLMLPDLLNLWLCGVAVAEHSNASTTQLYDPVQRDWSDDILSAFDIPRRLFPALVEPGTILGTLLPSIALDTGLGNVLVVAPATHDTASAVAAIPADDGDDWAYVSSGTWCLAGVELDAPLISEAGRAANVTNEQGVGGTTRLLKNTSGLFILQECLHGWGDPAIEAVLDAASASATDVTIDATDPRFLVPGADMPARIAAWCTENGIDPPSGEGDYTRVILRSLARAVGGSIDVIGQLAARQIKRIHVVGGGARMALLNQALADATGTIVVAGPVEATTAGNLLLQAEALAVIPRGAARSVMRRSSSLTRFEPRPSGTR